MATTIPERPVSSLPPGNYAMVASEYHRAFVDGLVSHASAELKDISPGSQIELHHVPGAFEIPLAVQSLAERGNLDAILAFGVIIEGATAHAGLIASTITQALMDIALAQRVPIIHEVLLVRDEAQARERCLGEHINRGTEAIRAAVRMADAMRAIRA